jgi:pimeloyl-ACP methyl ester carboxylesterase
LDSSFTWIINFPDQSLPYILADLGYDVWMGNVRGNRYALKHKTLNPSMSAFWDFSWDEHALVDLPSMIDYIRTTTSHSKVSYVGHSQGTTIMFAAMSALPDLSSKVDLFVGLGPVVTIQHQEVSGLTLLIELRVPELLYSLGLRNFLERPGLIFKFLGEEFCYINPNLCDSLIELVAGPHKHAFNDSRMDVMATHEPGGTSVKVRFFFFFPSLFSMNVNGNDDADADWIIKHAEYDALGANVENKGVSDVRLWVDSGEHQALQLHDASALFCA